MQQDAARRLSSATTVISIQGASSAKFRVSNTLDATIEGAGEISYIGDPQVTQRVSGVGTVEKALQ